LDTGYWFWIPGNNIQIFPLSTTLPQSTDDPKLNVVSDAVIQQKPGKIIPNPDIDLEPSQRSLPTPYFPQLTQTNIDEGVFTRYFLKRNDQFLYIEINFEEYELFSNRLPNVAWDLYDNVSISWIIDGDMFNVLETNKKTVLEIESLNSPFFPNGENWTEFSQIFKNNYLQFYQGIQENLSTPGGEYKTSDGKEYIGLYHIHPEKGPMVGATHISAPHDYLYSIKRNIRSILTGSTSPTTPNYTPPPSIGGSFSGGGY
jgi:hypothetical protein